MTRMTGPDCVVMCNLINTYIHTYIHTYMEEGGMATPLLQYVARFDGGGEIFGFGGGGYKESWPWCSLFVGFPSLFVAPSGEKPALRFRPRAVVAGRGVVAVCTRISSQEHVYDK